MKIILSHIDGSPIQLEIDLDNDTITLSNPDDGHFWAVVNIQELEKVIKFLKSNG